jgi:hypothetical protein
VYVLGPQSPAFVAAFPAVSTAGEKNCVAPTGSMQASVKVENGFGNESTVLGQGFVNVMMKLI